MLKKYLSHYIDEDLPYGDLTTSLQENTNFDARLEIFSREEIIVSGSEESAKIGKMLGCKSELFIRSGEKASSGEMILMLTGSYSNIHKAWKLSQVFLEYASGIATHTHKMVTAVREVSQKCQILGTRKTFPFAKKMCLKALHDGGGFAHRLNLSDSVLFFDKHRIVYQNNKEFYDAIPSFKLKAPEKKIVAEALDLIDAMELMQHGIDAVQLDKMSLEDTEKIVKYRDANYKNIIILSAGGINLKNAQEYAKLGIDGIVTSSIYSGKMADIGARMIKI